MAVGRTGWTSAEFKAVYARTVSDIFTFLARRVGPDVAEELTAQTFLDAWAVRDRYQRERGTEVAWLYGIAVNHLRHHYRHEERQDRAYQAAASREPRADELPGEADVVDRVDAQRRWRALARDIDRMTAAERDVFVLYALGELSYQDIARRLGIPVGTVRSRLSRCRARVNAELPTAPLPAP